MTFKLVTPLAMTNAKLTSSTVAEDDYDVWDISTSYVEDDYVIVTGSTHRIYQCVNPSGSLGDDPTTDDGTNWTDMGATNRWKVFDGYLADPALQAESAAWVVEMGENVNAVSLLNLDVAQVDIVMTDPTEGEVYNETFELDDNSAVFDWYAYFFAPIVRSPHLTVTDLPPYYEAELSITVTNTGDTAQVGQIVLGLAETLGDALNNMPFPYESYSRKETDAFGRVSVTARADADIINVSFRTESIRDTYVKNRLKARGNLPTLFTVDTQQGDNWHVVYGYVQSVLPEAIIGDHTNFDVEITGLV